MSNPRVMSQKEFNQLKREVQIFIITAMPVEEDAIIKQLDPITDGIISLYNNYRFGYFGKFLVAHQRAGQANLNAATAITSMLTEFGISSSAKKDFYVLMPGIACGLARSKDDQTLISISELKKYLDPNAPLKLPQDIKTTLKELLQTEKGKDKIRLPLFLTPEHKIITSNQHIGDILLATSIKQHSYKAIKPNIIEDRSFKYFPSQNRVSLILEMAKHWQFSHDANFQSQRCNVHPGLVISGDELLNHFNRRQDLISQYSDAIGLEMEGSALGASILNYSQQEHTPKAHFIFAKSICDWGVGKSDQWQKQAATASVSLLHFCLNDNNFFGNSIKSSDKNKIENFFSSKNLPHQKKSC